MEDEFDRLLELFAEPQEVKQEKVEEIFKLTMDFFERYKHVFASGTQEEKTLIQRKMDILKGRLKEENEATQAKIGLSNEEVREISINPKHFNEKQWNFLQKAQAALEEEKKQENIRMQQKKEERESSLLGKKKQKSTVKKSGWLKS